MDIIEVLKSGRVSRYHANDMKCQDLSEHHWETSVILQYIYPDCSKDTKNYPKGVWTLPPRLALDAQDKEKYLAIGESDRMTLKFIKNSQ